MHIPRAATRWQGRPDDRRVGPVPRASRGLSLLVAKSEKRKQKRKTKQNNKTSVCALMQWGWWEVCFSFPFSLLTQAGRVQTRVSVCSPVFAFRGPGSGLGPPPSLHHSSVQRQPGNKCEEMKSLRSAGNSVVIVAGDSSIGQQTHKHTWEPGMGLSEGTFVPCLGWDASRQGSGWPSDLSGQGESCAQGRAMRRRAICL